MQQAGVTPQNPMQQWQFAVEIGGFAASFFTECSGIEFENEVSKFAPGGSLSDQKTAGRVTYPPVTFKKGKNQTGVDNSILQWQQAIADAASGTGGLPTTYFRDIDVVEYDRTGTEVRRYRLYQCFIQRAKLGEYVGSSSEPVIEEVVVEFNRFDQVL